MSKMAWCILTIILVYILLPNLYYRYFSHDVIKKSFSSDKTVMLTFDDGPDPKYTPQLLDVLKKNNIKCTFFVLAENAEKYPDLIKRISTEGHYIGLHSFNHRNAIFTSPYKTKRDFSKSISIMNKLHIKINLFRPPWGMFNLLTFHYAKYNHFKVVLWSIHALDWSRWVTIDYIEEKLIKKVKPGDIILLHDGRGAKNAPRKTIKALEIILPALKNIGYQFMLPTDL